MRPKFLCFVVLCSCACSVALEVNDVIFHLFNRNRPTESQPLLAQVTSIILSDFALEKKTVITIHDFGESVSGNFNAFVIPSVLYNQDVNAVGVDWSQGSSHYVVGLANAPLAATYIASFIDLLVRNFGYSIDNFHIVGVGLGAHIAGIVGRMLDGNLPYITALDPSFVGWTHNSDILGPDAASYVEVLHTTAGILGYDYPLGHVDFYPNGGSYQNGCGTDSSCSKVYSYAFFAEALQAELTAANQFVGVECTSYEDALALSCNGVNRAIFGLSQPSTGTTGIYSFLTNFQQPFARG